MESAVARSMIGTIIYEALAVTLVHPIAEELALVSLRINRSILSPKIDVSLTIFTQRIVQGQREENSGWLKRFRSMKKSIVGMKVRIAVS